MKTFMGRKSCEHPGCTRFVPRKSRVNVCAVHRHDYRCGACNEVSMLVRGHWCPACKRASRQSAKACGEVRIEVVQQRGDRIDEMARRVAAGLPVFVASAEDAAHAKAAKDALPGS